MNKCKQVQEECRECEWVPGGLNEHGEWYEQGHSGNSSDGSNRSCRSKGPITWPLPLLFILFYLIFSSIYMHLHNYVFKVF